MGCCGYWLGEGQARGWLLPGPERRVGRVGERGRGVGLRARIEREREIFLVLFFSIFLFLYSKAIFKFI